MPEPVGAPPQVRDAVADLHTYRLWLRAVRAGDLAETYTIHSASPTTPTARSSTARR